jgi:hypothetical protein
VPIDVVRSSRPEVWHEELTHFRTLLSTSGLSIPAGSRIDAFGRASVAFEQKKITARQLKDPALHPLLEGARDFSELYLAARALLPSEDSLVLRRFREALGGSSMPIDSNRIPRTSQFELYLGGLLRHSGAGVEFAEPDLIVTTNGVTLGVAAKRIENTRQYRKRLRSGAEQLRKAGLRGIVAISFDVVAPAEYPGIIGPSLDAISSEVEPRLSSIVDPLESVTFDVVRGRPVVALLASVVSPAVVPVRNQIGRATATLLRIIMPQASNAERDALIGLTESLRRPTA